MNKEELLQQTVSVLSEHKAKNIQAIDVSNVTSVTDYFIIATGTSSTHLRALSDYVERRMSEQEMPALRSEGYRSANWILLDFGDAVVHLFSEASRAFYDLERLWKDGTPVDIERFLDRGEKES